MAVLILRAISVIAKISCSSDPEELVVGENTTGAQSRKVDIIVDCNVRAKCFSFFQIHLLHKK